MSFDRTDVEQIAFDTTGDEVFGLPSGTTAQRPTASNGYLRHNTDENVIEAYINGEWVKLDSSAYPPPFLGNRGLFGGGLAFGGPNLNTIDYIAIDTTGNATDFGDLLNSVNTPGACSNGSRGLFSGGYNGSVRVNDINYVTIATTGNAVDFGDLTVARNGQGGCSDGTYGVFGGGYSGVLQNTIDYVTIATTGNAQDFGDLTVARGELGSCSSETRGLFGGGITNASTGADTNAIDYITIATAGNAQDFGDLTVSRGSLSASSDGSRGVFGGGFESGNARVNTIDYVTIDTTGNAVDFGDLTVAKRLSGSSSNGTRGVFGGGDTSSSYINIIDYITIQTTGNATDFGDLTVTRRGASGLSGD